MAKNIKLTVEEIVKTHIENMGYEYVETEYSKQGKDYVLTIYIDSDKGIDLDDCEKVSRSIEPLIDEADPIEDSYCLCVSSVGLDKPLRTARDFEKNLGTCVDIKLYHAIEGIKEHSGRLVLYTEDTVTIEDSEQKKTVLNKKDIAKIVKHIDF